MNLLDILNAPWAIRPEKLHEIQGIYLTHLHGDKIDLSAIEKQIGKPMDNQREPYQILNGVAVIQMHGVVAKRMNLFTKISGGVSTQIAASEIKDALNSSDVQSILLDIDSPGGAVDGTFELANLIYESRGQKPIIAFTDGMMTSAAYEIGAAADKVYISSGASLIGDIGVVATHIDKSKLDAVGGIKRTEIFAGKYKRIASENAPLTKEGEKYMQEHVDYLYSVFVSDVAKFRGVSEQTALNVMADGRTFIGKQAIKAGLVDGVSTFDRLIESMAAGDAVVSNTVTAGDAEGRKITINVSPLGNPELSKNAIEQIVSAIDEVANNEREIDMDLAKLKADHPTLCEQILSEGEEKAKASLEKVHAEALITAKAAGTDQERARIKGVSEQSAPGHEALIEGLMYDGKSMPGDAAMAVNAAEKKGRSDMATAIEAGSASILKEDAREPEGEQSGDFEALVKAHMAEAKCTKGTATSAIVKSHPKEHQAYIAKVNKGGKS